MARTRWTVTVEAVEDATDRESFGIYAEYGKAETCCGVFNRKLRGSGYVAVVEAVRPRLSAVKVLAFMKSDR